MTLERRLSKLEASILPEVRPPKVVVIEGYRDGEDMDAAQERHFAAHPEDRGATLVVFIRKMLRDKDWNGRHRRPRWPAGLRRVALDAMAGLAPPIGLARCRCRPSLSDPAVVMALALSSSCG